MTTLTVEYLRNNYPSLEDVKEEDLDAVLVDLANDWITTADKFNRATRDGLLKKGYPLGFVDAVKPEEETNVKGGQQGKIPKEDFEVQTFDGIDTNIVGGSDDPGTIQIGWRREREEYFPIKLFLRHYLTRLKGALDKFMNDKKKRHMYIQGPPGSGKTTYCIFYFTLYMIKNNQKGLIIQYRSEASNEVMIVEEQQIRRVTRGTAAATLPGLVSSLLQQETFDFVVFDGVRQREDPCKLVGSAIANDAGPQTKIIKITSLEFDVKGGESTGGIHGYDSSFIASSWEYAEYENAVDSGLLNLDALEKILCVDSDYEHRTDTTEENVKMEDAEENDKQEIGGVQQDAERLEWLKSLLPRKHFYAGGSARYMFEYTIDQLIVSTDDKKSVFDGVCGQMEGDDWEAFATLNISSSTPSSVSSGMQRINGQYIPVSEYFLHLAHQKCKAKLTKSVRSAAENSDNPALKGWAFELEQLDIIEQMMNNAQGALVSEDSTLVLPVPVLSGSSTYDGIRLTSDPQGNNFTIWCSKWNQGCFDVAFYTGQTLITANFTISSSHTLKINPLRDLVKALQLSARTVQQIYHIAIVEEKADEFSFNTPEGVGKTTEQILYSVVTACSQKLKATIPAHAIAGRPAAYGAPLGTVDVYPREWTSPRKRKKVDYSGLC